MEKRRKGEKEKRRNGDGRPKTGGPGYSPFCIPGSLKPPASGGDWGTWGKGDLETGRNGEREKRRMVESQIVGSILGITVWCNTP